MKSQSTVLEVISKEGFETDTFFLNQYDHLFFDKPPNKKDLEYMYYQKRTKYCPGCITASHYHRLQWDVSIVSVCLEHRCRLIDACPNCSCIIPISSFMVGFCKCGFYFNEAETIKPSEMEFQAQTLLQSLLKGEQFEVALPRGGDKLTAPQFFKILHLFSSLLDKLPLKHPVFSSHFINREEANYLLLSGDKRDLDMIVAIEMAAFGLLMHPESHFDEIIMSVEEITSYTQNQFEYRRGVLQKILAIEQLATHRQMYHDCMKILSSVKKCTVEGIESRYCTIRETLDSLGIVYKEAMRLIKHGHLVPRIRRGRTRSLTMIPKSSIEKWKQKRLLLLSTDQIASLFEIHRIRICELAQKGVIDVCRGPNADGFGYWRFEHNTLEEFKFNLFGSSIPIQKRTSEWLSFNEAVLSLRNSGYNCVRFIEVLLERSLKTAVLNGRFTFKGLYIHQTEIIKLIDEARINRIAEIGYTVTEVARMFRVATRKVHRWIREGKMNVSHTKTKGSVIVMFVAKEEVESFVCPL